MKKEFESAKKIGILRGTIFWTILYENISDEVFKKLARCLIETGTEDNLLDDQTKGYLKEEAKKRNIIL